MRIQEFRINGLFGIFNHEVKLNLDEKITIVHGPNGFGKTAILRIIDSIFNTRYAYLRQVPFSSIEIHFDNSKKLSITKTYDTKAPNDEVPNPGNNSEIKFSYNKEDYLLPSIFSNKSVSQRRRFLSLEEYLPFVRRLDGFRWTNLHTGEVLSVDDITMQFGHMLPDSFSKAKDLPPGINKLFEEINVHFVKAHRLQSQDSPSTHPEPNNPNKLAVDVYSKQLADQIGHIQRKYGEVAQSLDRSFPVRSITQPNLRKTSEVEILTQLKELEAKRNNLMTVGLLSKDEPGESMQINNTIDNAQLNMLAVYVADTTEKLSVFDVLYEKINLFKTIANKKFQFKTMSINPKSGFEFTTFDNKPLSSSNLSTGEQHEIVLLYELLFRVEANSLVLIDEPEISLHIAWQEQFLSDLAQITKLSDFDALVATHSPEIINSRWDLTVSLKGPGKVSK